MAKELFVGIVEKDANGKSAEVDVSDWTKLDDCRWDKVRSVFGKLPSAVALLRPRAEMLQPEGFTIPIPDRRGKSWANVTFDQNFIAECFRRDYLAKLEIEPKTALEKIGGWLNWISQKDTREIKTRVDDAIIELQKEYVKVYGTPLPIDEAIKTLKVSQPMLMRDYQSVTALV